VCFLFFVCFLSSLVWFFLWLPEEELTLLFLLHRENGDFSILMKDNSNKVMTTLIVVLPSKLLSWRFLCKKLSILGFRVDWFPFHWICFYLVIVGFVVAGDSDAE
jgi:hypothetical protein